MVDQTGEGDINFDYTLEESEVENIVDSIFSFISKDLSETPLVLLDTSVILISPSLAVEEVSVSDTCIPLKIVYRVDSQSLSDELKITAYGTSETVVLDDNIILDVTPAALEETQGSDDSILFSTSTEVQEVIVLSDAVTVVSVFSYSETQATSDAISITGYGRSESILLTDSISKSTSTEKSEEQIMDDFLISDTVKVLTEEENLADTVILEPGHFILDYVFESDSISKLVSPSAKSETVVTADSIISKTTTIKSETISLSDTLTFLRSKILSDSQSVGNTISKLTVKNLEDFSVVSDSISVSYLTTLNESVVTSDTVANGITRDLIETETVDATDDVVYFFAGVALEYIATYDSLTIGLGSYNETVAASDSFEYILTPFLPDDDKPKLTEIRVDPVLYSSNMKTEETEIKILPTLVSVEG